MDDFRTAKLRISLSSCCDWKVFNGWLRINIATAEKEQQQHEIFQLQGIRPEWWDRVNPG